MCVCFFFSKFFSKLHFFVRHVKSNQTREHVPSQIRSTKATQTQSSRALDLNSNDENSVILVKKKGGMNSCLCQLSTPVKTSAEVN